MRSRSSRRRQRTRDKAGRRRGTSPPGCTSRGRQSQRTDWARAKHRFRAMLRAKRDRTADLSMSFKRARSSIMPIRGWTAMRRFDRVYSRSGPLANEWAEHQLRERPHEGVEAVWAFRANVAGARHVEHLLLELREAANVADLTLSVERGDRLGPDCLAARRRDGLDRHVRASGRDHVLDHGAAEASFGDDAVGPELVIGGHCEPCPLCRPQTGRANGKHITGRGHSNPRKRLSACLRAHPSAKRLSPPVRPEGRLQDPLAFAQDTDRPLQWRPWSASAALV